MTQHKKASFGFRKFTVPSFSYHAKEGHDVDLDLSFNPSGEYNEKKRTYYLTLDLRGVASSDKTQVISAISVAEFNFSDDTTFADIPEYFYANAIAIMFPYVRAFVNTLTLQANTGIIMLETLNLSALKDVLKSNSNILASNKGSAK